MPSWEILASIMKMIIKSVANPITTMQSESHKHDNTFRKKAQTG